MNKIAGRRQFLKLLAGSSAIGALAACAAPAAPGEGSQAPVTPAGGEPGATPQAVMDTGPRVGGTTGLSRVVIS